MSRDDVKPFSRLFVFSLAMCWQAVASFVNGKSQGPYPSCRTDAVFGRENFAMRIALVRCRLLRNRLDISIRLSFDGPQRSFRAISGV